MAISVAYIFYQLNTLGCTPLCINGVIDHAVVDFTAGLMDVLMELGFGRAQPGSRWRSCKAKLTMLAKALAESAPPNWVNAPARDRHAELGMLVDRQILLALDDDDDSENEGRSSSPDLTSPNLTSPNELLPSLAGPSTSILARPPIHPTAATVDGASLQGLPAGNVEAAAQVLHLQKLLKRMRRSLQIARGMLISFMRLDIPSKSLFDRLLWDVLQQINLGPQTCQVSQAIKLQGA